MLLHAPAHAPSHLRHAPWGSTTLTLTLPLALTLTLTLTLTLYPEQVRYRQRQRLESAAHDADQMRLLLEDTSR